MNIGFDLDYTLGKPRVDFWTLASENLRMGRVEPFTKWGFPEYPNALAEECNRLFRMNWYMNDLLYFHLEATNVVSQLCMAGHQVFIITARHPEVREGTEARVRRAFGSMVTRVLYADPNYSKMQEFLDNQIDIWVDDRQKDLHVAAERGIKVIGMRQPWNRLPYNEKTDHLVHWVDGLQEAYNHMRMIPGFDAARKRFT